MIIVDEKQKNDFLNKKFYVLYHKINTTITKKYTNTNYLEIEIFCRMNEKFENNIKYFVLKLPIYFQCSISLSAFYFISNEYEKFEKTTDKKDKDIKFFENVKKFLNIVPYLYQNKGCCYTNFLPIHLKTYMITTKNIFHIFKEIHNVYPFFVDFFLYYNNLSFEFNIQKQINIGNVFSLKKFNFNLFKVEICTYDNLINKYLNITIKNINELNNICSQSFNYDNLIKYKNLSDKYFDIIFGDSLNIEDSIKYKLINIKYDVLCFDIETGFLDINQQGFPMPPNSYLQVIGFIESTFKNGYSNSMKKTIYIHSTQFTKSDILESFTTKIYNIVFFENEIDMIKSFLELASSKDFIYGYNSKEFDLPYLINRYSFLKFRQEFGNQINLKVLKKNLHINIVPLRSSNNFPIQKVTSIYNYRTSFLCPKCKTKNNVNSPLSNIVCYNKDCGEIFNDQDLILKIEDLSIDKTKVNSNTNEFPFTVHIDLFTIKDLIDNSKNSNLPNKKLETIANFYFKVKIKNIIYNSVDTLCLELNNNFSYTDVIRFIQRFLEDIKCVIFLINKQTNQFENRIEMRLQNINIFLKEDDQMCNLKDWENTYNICFFDKSTHASVFYNKCKNVTNSFFEQSYYKICLVLKKPNDLNIESFNYFLENIQVFYISIGKTSDLDLQRQQHWLIKDDCIKTSEYCIKDVEITFQLEYMLNSIINFQTTTRWAMPLFDVFTFQMAQKSEYEYIFALYPRILLFCLTNLVQIELLNNALKIEYPKLEYFVENNLLSTNTFLLEEEKKNVSNITTKNDNNEKEKLLSFLNDQFKKSKFENNSIELMKPEVYENLKMYKMYTINNLMDIFTSKSKDNINENLLRIGGEYNCANGKFVFENFKNFISNSN